MNRISELRVISKKKLAFSFEDPVLLGMAARANN
jgi:hypothetical protein